MKFEAIDLCHKDKIEYIRKKYVHSLSSHAFSSLYLWQDKMKLSVYLSEEMFCVKREDMGINNYFFPCGDTAGKIRLITSLTKNEFVVFHYMREEDKLFLEEHFAGGFNFISAREDWEYIYDKGDQIKLEGSNFKHLRTKIRKGKNMRNWTVEKLCEDNISYATDVAMRWNDEVKHNGESTDIKATLKAFESFGELDLSGILLLEDKTPFAFALGTAITDDTFDLHISKTIEGDIDCYLKCELYRQLPDEILHINREEDLGIEGLRIHKTDMRPARFNELWKGWTRTNEKR